MGKDRVESTLEDHFLATSTSYSCFMGMMVTFLLGMLFMFSRASRNLI